MQNVVFSTFSLRPTGPLDDFPKAPNPEPDTPNPKHPLSYVGSQPVNSEEKTSTPTIQPAC